MLVELWPSSLRERERESSNMYTHNSLTHSTSDRQLAKEQKEGNNTILHSSSVRKAKQLVHKSINSYMSTFLMSRFTALQAAVQKS